jgi:hypothetical protein
MSNPLPQSPETIALVLGWYYLVCAGLNVAACGLAARARSLARAAFWLFISCGFLVLSIYSFSGHPAGLPDPLKALTDSATSPASFALLSFIALTLAYLARRWLVIPSVGWALLNASLVWLGLSLADPQFAAVVGHADNLPIVAMVYLLAIFLWIGAAQAVANDRRKGASLQPVEADYAGKVLVWPDLVYIELIAMVLLTGALFAWSIAVRAPLESPANPAVTPNPSKAPWYFLGIQEMLVYFDASMAGAIIPCLIVLGLAAIPYLDRNPKGSGYYTIAERRGSYLVFLFGFLQLWILLILVGTFMRGPSWNSYGPYELRDPNKPVALANVTLSEYLWVRGLGRPLHEPPADATPLVRFGAIAWREIPGIAILGLYFGALPWVLGRTIFRDLKQRMGRVRYLVMTLLLLMMLMLPVKMILRWTVDLSYIVSVPEWFFNF